MTTSRPAGPNPTPNPNPTKPPPPTPTPTSTPPTTVDALDPALEQARRYWDGVAAAEAGRAALILAGVAPPEGPQRAARIIAEANRLCALFGRRRRVIDFGCGDGRIAALLAPHAKALVAYDLSGLMRAEAAQNLAAFPHAVVRSTDGRTIDAPTASADLIVVLHVLETLPVAIVAAVVAEVARALAPEGRAVLHLAADDADARERRALHGAPGAASAVAFVDPVAVGTFLSAHGLAVVAIDREGVVWRVVSARAAPDAARPTAADCREFSIPSPGTCPDGT